MDIYNLLYLELTLLKQQYRAIIVGLIIGILGTFFLGMGNFWIGYYFYLVIFWSETPFLTEKAYRSGFYELLPAKTKNKVISRYLFLAAMNTAGLIISFINQICLILAEKSPVSLGNTIFPIMLITFLSLFTGSIQYIIYYRMEAERELKSMTFVNLFPAFIVLLAGGYAQKIFLEYQPPQLLIGAAILAFTGFFGGIWFSTSICKKRDI